MGAEVVELAARFVDDRYNATTFDYSDLSPLLNSLSQPPADEGAPFAALLGTIEAAAGKGFDTANPGFLAYIPGGGLFASALAEMMSTASNHVAPLRTLKVAIP